MKHVSRLLTLIPTLATTLASTLLLSLPASAVPSKLTVQQLLQRMKTPNTILGFTGKRYLDVYRQKSDPFKATADIVFADRNNYDVKITGPSAIANVQFNMQKGVNSAYFPDERLFLTHGGPDTSYMPERVILSLFTPRIDLIAQNYDIKIHEDAFISSNDAYVVEFIPKNKTVGKDDKGADTKDVVAMVPRRKYWIEKESFAVLKEQRLWDNVNTDGSWGFTNQAYSEAAYSIFKKEAKPKIPAVTPASGVTAMKLSADQDKNSFLTYKTVAEAEKTEGIQISMPNYMPKGFAFKDVQVFTLFGARIQVLNFTDGINDFMITVRPEQNAFVTLMVGASSLSLIKKITDLSHQAPNNYHSVTSPKRVAVAFGDMHPAELMRVAQSLTLH